jgi:hypothetical protein
MTITISARKLAIFCFTVVGGLIAVDAAMNVLQFGMGHDHLFGLIHWFDLDSEQNIPTWYSVLQLAGCAGVLALIWTAKRRARETGAHYWAVLGAGFLFMSLDELGELHERLMGPISRMVNADGQIHDKSIWLLAAAPVVVLIGLYFVPFLRSIPHRHRIRFLAAGVIFLLGAMVFERVDDLYWVANGNRQDLTWSMLTTLEDSCEMFGVALFLFSLVRYVEETAGAIRFQLGESRAARSVTTAAGAPDEGAASRGERTMPAGVRTG